MLFKASYVPLIPFSVKYSRLAEKLKYKYSGGNYRCISLVLHDT